MSIKGLIVAAGCSSRIGRFKPMLDINGYPLIAWAVMNLKNGGIKDIYVVTGRDSAKLEAVLEPFNVNIVLNQAYETTDMLCSVKLGISSLIDETTEGVLLLPGDLGMISPKTIGAMVREFLRSRPSVLYPCYDNQRTHPPLIGRKCFDTVLSFSESGGLRRALLPFEETAQQLQLTDKGTSMDADYPEDYINMVAYAKEHFGISPKLCDSMMEEVCLPEHIRKHTIAVAKLAVEMGEKLIQNGYPLDLTLVESGALLHDLLRTEPHHAEKGKLFLLNKGYTALAELVGNHMSFRNIDDPRINEETLVFLADKLVGEEDRTSLTERYAVRNNPQNTEIGRRIALDQEKAEKLLSRLSEIISMR